MPLFISVLLQDPNHYVNIESSRAQNPPRLVIDGKDFPATADSLLISYLADRAFPSMPNLAVSLGDTNRALLRFDLDGVAAPKKAVLVLSVKPSENPPEESFELGVFAVTSDWTGKTTWSSQPAFDSEPAARATIAPLGGEVRIDVTNLVRKGLKHGLLLKVTKPVGGDPEARREVERHLRTMMAWRPSVDAARKSGKLVLAFVTAEDSPADMPLAETVLLATLAHPDLRSLVEKRYATVRVVVNPSFYAGGRIEALGISMTEAKPPALVLTNGEGKVLRTLASIGTFDAEAFLEFLRRGLDDVEKPKPSPADKGATLVRQGRFAEAGKALAGLEDPPSLYLAGCLEWRNGDPDKARSAWEAITKKHAKSPWALKALARLAWPERMSIYESLAATEAVGATTEVPAKDAKRAVERGASYLIGQQLRDGSWPVPDQADVHRAAVTALAATALFAWSGEFEDEQRRRVNAAVSRATEWLKLYLAKADPGRANSWGTAYVLDYFVDRHAADKGFGDSVEKAAALHLGGQLPNGAWSYDRAFGTKWRGGFGGWPKTDKGRAHSMNTGPALIALARAKRAGFKLDEGALAKGVEALLAMRKRPGIFTYTWPEPDSFSELDQSVGRASGCEQALRMLRAAGEKDADAAIGAFMKWRGDLRIPVKMTGGWIAPRATSAYFYHVAYYDAARLIAERGGDGAKEKLSTLRDDLLAVVEADGSWVDFHSTGKPVATAMALMVIRMAR